jgi:hypothetical protein
VTPPVPTTTTPEDYQTKEAIMKATYAEAERADQLAEALEAKADALSNELAALTVIQ